MSSTEGFNPEMLKMMQGTIDEKMIVSPDKTKVLFETDIDDMKNKVKELAEKAEQKVDKVKEHVIGDIVTMSDGTRYKVQQSGWIKLDSEDPLPEGDAWIDNIEERERKL